MGNVNMRLVWLTMTAQVRINISEPPKLMGRKLLHNLILDHVMQSLLMNSKVIMLYKTRKIIAQPFVLFRGDFHNVLPSACLFLPCQSPPLLKSPS